MKEGKNSFDILTFDEKELFNDRILQQYDEDGQKGVLGYLLRYKQWKIENNKIVFPDIKTRLQIFYLLREYENDERIQNTKIRQQVIRNVKSFGVEFCEKQEENRLLSFENKKKEIERKQKRTKESER